MKKIISFILTAVFVVGFFILLVIFHPIQWLCLKMGGYASHKVSVDILNFFLVKSYWLLGNNVKFTNRQQLPQGRPIIFVSNHQSMFDIPPLIYYLRRHHAKFISKIELASGIPSVSFNLRHGGGANIDRKDPKQSVAEILKLAANMQQYNWSAVIFPEGTRSKTGAVKSFNVGGIATILKKVPEALIVPVVINNSWKIVQHGLLPMGAFLSLTWEVLAPIEPSGRPIEEVVEEAEQAIRARVI